MMWPEKTVSTLLFVACVSATATVNKTQLYFSYITSKTGEQFVSSGGIPAVDLALEQINSNSTILANYTLNYTEVLDSKCNRTAALDAFFKHFQNLSQPTYVSLLCCGCSTATIPVAEISHYWNVPQMAYAAAASVLSDRQKYRSFFRTIPSFDNLAPSIVALMDQFQWTQMLTFTQDESLFVGVTDALEDIFASRGWNLQNVLIPTEVDTFPYEQALSWTSDFRILFVNTYQPHALSLLCEGYARGIVSPSYVWITLGVYPEGWWEDSTNSSCPPEVILDALSNSLAIIPDGYFNNEDKSAQSISSLTPDEFVQQYTSLLQLPEYQQYQQYSVLSTVGVAYDAIWALALGLDRASERIRSNNDSGCEHLPGDLVPLEEFNYTNAKVGCVLEESFGETKFTGITGDISFNVNGSRYDNTVLLQQYRIEEGTMKVGLIFVADITVNQDDNEFRYRASENSTTLWGDTVPYDGATTIHIEGNNPAVVAVFYTLASIGVICTMACLIFNIVFRNKLIVKLSSPNLNYFIIAGALMMYVCIYFVAYTFSGLTQTVVCNINLWLFSMGYTLCFAIILAKTWRVYYIFSNPTTKKKAIKDWILLAIVGAVVGVDALILLVGTAVSETRLNATLILDGSHPTVENDQGQLVENYVYICTAPDGIIWQVLSFAYKVMLQLLAMFMAFHTRKVKIKALNDSKEIAIIVYTNSVTLILLMVTVFVLSKYHLFYSSVFSLATFIGTSIFLGPVFIPKMVNLYRDPEGKNIFTSTVNGGGDQMESAMQAKTTIKGRSKSLFQRNESNLQMVTIIDRSKSLIQKNESNLSVTQQLKQVDSKTHLKTAAL